MTLRAALLYTLLFILAGHLLASPVHANFQVPEHMSYTARTSSRVETGHISFYGDHSKARFVNSDSLIYSHMTETENKPFAYSKLIADDSSSQPHCGFMSLYFTFTMHPAIVMQNMFLKSHLMHEVSGEFTADDGEPCTKYEYTGDGHFIDKSLPGFGHLPNVSTVELCVYTADPTKFAFMDFTYRGLFSWINQHVVFENMVVRTQDDPEIYYLPPCPMYSIRPFEGVFQLPEGYKGDELLPKMAEVGRQLTIVTEDPATGQTTTSYADFDAGYVTTEAAINETRGVVQQYMLANDQTFTIVSTDTTSSCATYFTKVETFSQAKGVFGIFIQVYNLMLSDEPFVKNGTVRVDNKNYDVYTQVLEETDQVTIVTVHFDPVMRFPIYLSKEATGDYPYFTERKFHYEIGHNLDFNNLESIDCAATSPLARPKDDNKDCPPAVNPPDASGAVSAGPIVNVPSFFVAVMLVAVSMLVFGTLH